jgi:SAM-dependent methyltransferase
MTQQHIWDREYKKQHLMTNGDKPQQDTLDFLKFLKREQKVQIEGKSIIDLGCGTGRNSNYLAELGATVTGIEISQTALKLAHERNPGTVTYLHHSMGEVLPFADASFDIALDVTSSNSLTEAEREIYIKELHRVLKPGAFFFFKGLCKDGDHNAKNLLKMSPGKEYDTYIMPEIGLTERVWSKEDFIKYYSPFFNIISLEKKTNYSKFNNQSYKRNFWLGYLTRMEDKIL